MTKPTRFLFWLLNENPRAEEGVFYMSKLRRDQQSVKLWSVVQAHRPGLIADRLEKNIEIRL
ncbi:hypothetical protein [Oscillatoria acuminata]|uniref:Uncharacterized protein n=1 Tax=Oscillatoria acuminata PCC 6304 TaxID=56110 RepID=K9TKL7_9CYAN|nr:hypothetical protein [Oscillatoria acuminata]AFY82564.1 hypothetical protein Oscil6304_2965 [Oscillatoria acuminata PCC 6304]